jgi:transmembrane sensor
MRDRDKNVVPFPDAATVEAEAAQWVVRFDAGATAEDYAKFQEWQAKSPQHRDAAARLMRLWNELDFAKQLATPVAPAHTVPYRARGRRRWRWVAVAAAASVLVVAGSLPFYRTLHTVPPVISEYRTPVGAQKTVVLADGSSMQLNTDTAVRVEMSDARRDVHLVRGEAYFEVVHDEHRPFAVHAGQGVVRDIGTAFNVRLEGKSVDVTVVRGNVELAASTAADGTHEQHLGNLAAGQNAVFARKVERLSLVSDTLINRRLAWRQGVLVYSGEALAQVVADYNRYSDIKVEVADAKLSALQVGGYFEIGKDAAFLEALKDNFGIDAHWRDDHHVVLVAGHRASHAR